MHTIIKTTDDIFNSKGIIAHGCNALGIMGAGFALHVKKRYPEAYKQYRSNLELGQVSVVKVSDDLFIANCITQFDFGKDGRRYVNYEALAECFEELNGWSLPIHYPLIGCGLAGGDWDVVSSIIKSSLTNHKESYLHVL